MRKVLLQFATDTFHFCSVLKHSSRELTWSFLGKFCQENLFRFAYLWTLYLDLYCRYQSVALRKQK